MLGNKCENSKEEVLEEEKCMIKYTFVNYSAPQRCNDTKFFVRPHGGMQKATKKFGLDRPKLTSFLAQGGGGGL